MLVRSVSATFDDLLVLLRAPRATSASLALSIISSTLSLGVAKLLLGLTRETIGSAFALEILVYGGLTRNGATVFDPPAFDSADLVATSMPWLDNLQ